VRGSSHVLIGNPFWSHSKDNKLFFWNTFADYFLFVFVLSSKNSDFLLQAFFGQHMNSGFSVERNDLWNDLLLWAESSGLRLL